MKKFFSIATTSSLIVAGLSMSAMIGPTSAEQKEPLFDCTLSEESSIHRSQSVMMQKYVNTEAGTLKIRIRTSRESWIGVGVNYDGEATMAPSYAVIGRVEDDGSTSVLRYWIDSAREDGIVALDDPNGHLKEASFTQENGESILEFEHDLFIMENGVVTLEIGPDSTWIFAVGPDDNDWGGRHRVHGSFNLAFSEDCVVRATEKPTKAPSNATLDDAEPVPSPAPPVTSPTPAPVDSNTSQTGDATSPSEATSTEGANAESQEAPSSQGLWVTHGIFMAFAWGLIAPLAIGASLFRNRLDILRTNDRWFKIHLYLNITVATLTFLGFFLAVAATNRDGDLPHFQANPHNKVGLTIFLFVVLQLCAGYFRPAPPSDQTADEPDVDEKKTDNEHPQDQSTDPTETEAIEVAAGDDGDHPEGSIVSDDSWSLFTAPPPPPPPPSTAGDGQRKLMSTRLQFVWSDGATARQYWKYGHRLMGMILLGMAWYNCQSGIVLLSTDFFDEEKEKTLLGAFWGIVGTIACTFLLMGYVVRD